MKKLLILFIIGFLMISSSYGGTTAGDFLIYDNSSYNVDQVLYSLGYSYYNARFGGDYEEWDPSFHSTTTGSQFATSPYKFIIAASDSDYQGLKDNITNYPSNNFTDALGRIVISGQKADVKNKPELLANMINWVEEGYNNGEGLGLIMFADTANQWDWFPGISTSDASNTSGNSVNFVSEYSNHMIHTGVDYNALAPNPNITGISLTESDLSNWGNSYDVTFGSLPEGFAAITTADNGEAITIIGGTGVGGGNPIPEPMTIGLFLIGIIGIFRIYKK